ncbi:Exonuclease [Macleaya cordata]|uniref:Exonuclease n=1 Tax=Macleaya cordata TaxID=56857 RepID=A0A200Q2C3_MACCD|nr:Exonuclease [Macleaya cordata]
MNGLSNAFAVLDLDVEDSTEQTATDANGDNSGGVSVKKDKGIRRGDKASEMTTVKYDKQDQQSLPTTSEEYKLPLVWIDLEMTGLDIEIDRILEIACVITDGNLTKSVEGPDLVIHQSKECLDKMGEWCQEHHAASGLTKKVLQSTINEREAEKQVIEFVKNHVALGTHKPLLAGNSVYVDFQFLKKYMPDLASLFSHVIVDVSSVKALCIRWFPRDNRKAPSKENKHRAMDDIKESIKELKYYKENIFKPREETPKSIANA